jgi:tetratricopeptide (TPR) repeat protein
MSLGLGLPLLLFLLVYLLLPLQLFGAMGVTEDLVAAASAQQTGDIERAAKLYGKASKELSSGVQPRAQANAALGEAESRLAARQLDKARQGFSAALRIAEERGFEAERAAALTGLARISIVEGRYSEAQTLLDRALMATKDSEAARAKVKLAQAELAIQKKDIRSARQPLTEAEALYSKLGNPLGEAHVQRLWGDVESTADRSESAVAHYQRAIDLYKKAGDRAGMANATLGLSVHSRREGNIQGAKARLERAAQLFEEVGSVVGKQATAVKLKALTPTPGLSVTYCPVGTEQGKPQFEFWLRVVWPAHTRSLAKTVEFEFTHPSLKDHNGPVPDDEVCYFGGGCDEALTIHVAYETGAKKEFTFDTCQLQKQAEGCPALNRELRRRHPALKREPVLPSPQQKAQDE